MRAQIFILSSISLFNNPKGLRELLRWSCAIQLTLIIDLKKAVMIITNVERIQE